MPVESLDRRQISKRAVRSEMVVVLLESIDFILCIVQRNQLMFENSFLHLPLKDSIMALSVDFPGLEKSNRT